MNEEEDLVPVNQQQSPPQQAVLTSSNRLNLPRTPATNGKYRCGRKSDKGEDKLPKGQKKRQRYENSMFKLVISSYYPFEDSSHFFIAFFSDKFLLNLTKSENDESGISGPGFSDSRSVFTTLLQQADKMAAWNAFLAFCDDDQQAIIENDEMLAYFNNEPVLMEQAPSVVVKKIAEVRDNRRALTADQAFGTLCPKLKSLFSKRHFPMVMVCLVWNIFYLLIHFNAILQGILVKLENEVVDFFLETPKGTCVIERSCSFDRCILHAVTQFNYLYSQSNKQPF